MSRDLRVGLSQWRNFLSRCVYYSSLNTALADSMLQLCPDRDVLSELGGPFDKDAWLAKGGVKGASVMPTPSTSENRHPHPIPPPLTPHDDEELGPSDNEITARRTLEMGMKNLRINAGHPRFFGKSSSVMFLQTAIMLRHEYTGAEMARLGPEGKKVILPCKRPEFWRAHPVSTAFNHSIICVQRY